MLHLFSNNLRRVPTLSAGLARRWRAHTIKQTLSVQNQSHNY